MLRLNDQYDDEVMKLVEHVLKTRFGYTLADISDPPEVTQMAGKLIAETMRDYAITTDLDPALVACHAAQIIIKLNARVAELEAELTKLKSSSSPSP